MCNEPKNPTKEQEEKSAEQLIYMHGIPDIMRMPESGPAKEREELIEAQKREEVLALFFKKLEPIINELKKEYILPNEERENLVNSKLQELDTLISQMPWPERSKEEIQIYIRLFIDWLPTTDPSEQKERNSSVKILLLAIKSLIPTKFIMEEGQKRNREIDRIIHDVRSTEGDLTTICNGLLQCFGITEQRNIGAPQFCITSVEWPSEKNTICLEGCVWASVPIGVYIEADIEKKKEFLKHHPEVLARLARELKNGEIKAEIEKEKFLEDYSEILDLLVSTLQDNQIEAKMKENEFFEDYSKILDLLINTLKNGEIEAEIEKKAFLENYSMMLYRLQEALQNCGFQVTEPIGMGLVFKCELEIEVVQQYIENWFKICLLTAVTALAPDLKNLMHGKDKQDFKTTWQKEVPLVSVAFPKQLCTLLKTNPEDNYVKMRKLMKGLGWELQASSPGTELHYICTRPVWSLIRGLGCWMSETEQKGSAAFINTQPNYREYIISLQNQIGIWAKEARPNSLVYRPDNPNFTELEDVGLNYHIHVFLGNMSDKLFQGGRGFPLINNTNTAPPMWQGFNVYQSIIKKKKTDNTQKK